MIPNIQNSSNKVLGSSLSLPAHGWVGARATPFLAAHFAKRNTKFGGGNPSSSPAMAGHYGARSEGGPRRRNFVSLRGKQKFLLFACPVASRRLCYGARPSENYQKSASGPEAEQSSLRGKIFAEKGSDFVQGVEPTKKSPSRRFFDAAPFLEPCSKIVAGPGLEPGINGFKGHCPTIRRPRIKQQSTINH